MPALPYLDLSSYWPPRDVHRASFIWLCRCRTHTIISAAACLSSPAPFDFNCSCTSTLQALGGACSLQDRHHRDLLKRSPIWPLHHSLLRHQGSNKRRALRLSTSRVRKPHNCLCALSQLVYFLTRLGPSEKQTFNGVL